MPQWTWESDPLILSNFQVEMMPTTQQQHLESIPVFLLKTKSSPGDSYEDLFKFTSRNVCFEPVFVPVLQHTFHNENLASVKSILQQRGVGASPRASFGGLIFTSQRAVEAFVKVAEDGQQDADNDWPYLQSVPVYSVGPATTRALSAVPSSSPLEVFGSHTGNGEALATFILDHYSSVYPSRVPKPPLLFLVGEQRRDIIPKTLMDPSLSVERQIRVVESTVYGTGVMATFPADFASLLRATASRKLRWVVVFSPTGCEDMLRALGFVDEATGRVKDNVNGDTSRSTFVATIGPTTRDFLKATFGFDADVSAEKPSPEGVLEAIVAFTKGLGIWDSVAGLDE